MKLGIVGPADRAMAWEKHLRPHGSVSEVTITSRLKDIGNVDACLLLDESENRLELLLEAVKKGYHTFLVAPLPTDREGVERVYHAAEESNVLLQFSHWPTLAPASKWMSKKIVKPSFIQITREINYSEYLESGYSFDYYWVDELAFSLRWINSAVHHIDLQPVSFSQDTIYALQMFLRFESGATANIYVNATSEKPNHHRIAANKNYLLDCNVANQTVRLGEQKNDLRHLYFNRQTFDATKSAELAALEFIKSIQLNRPTIYNGYHLLELTKIMEKVNKRLART
jgi:predicted dehydrogenase